MSARKTFDLVLVSKYVNKGVKGAVAGLKSLGEASFFIQHGIAGPIGRAGKAILDLIGIANPERIKRFSGEFDKLGKNVSILADRFLGPLIDILGGIVNGITDVVNAFNEVTGAAAAYRAELDRVYRSQKLVSDFAKGLVEGLADAGALMQGLKEKEAVYAKTHEATDKARADSSQQRSRLILDIAQKEADRLEDIARQNAKQMQAIDAQRTEALQNAKKQYDQSIADLDQQTADQRIQIEENFQERMRQIKDSSDEDIDEAIRRRDARALAKAMSQRNEQVGQAKRDRDKALADNQKQADATRAQAQRTYQDQQRAAEESARKAIEALREQNREAALEARIAADRQLRDFNTSNRRRLADLEADAQEERNIVRRKYEDLKKEHGNYLQSIATATEQAIQRSGPIGQAVVNLVHDVIDEITKGVKSGRGTGGRHAVGAGQ